MTTSGTGSANDEHSGRTRVTPVFTWLREHGGSGWVTELLRLADGIQVPESVGEVITQSVGKERESSGQAPERLAWMIAVTHTGWLPKTVAFGRNISSGVSIRQSRKRGEALRRARHW